MIVAKFSTNIKKNLEQILSYCINNGIDSYVDFDNFSNYTVKIDVKSMFGPKAVELIRHLNNLKKTN